MYLLLPFFQFFELALLYVFLTLLIWLRRQFLSLKSYIGREDFKNICFPSMRCFSFILNLKCRVFSIAQLQMFSYFYYDFFFGLYITWNFFVCFSFSKYMEVTLFLLLLSVISKSGLYILFLDVFCVLNVVNTCVI